MSFIAVSGATGYVGTWVTRALVDQGHQVYGICRPSSKKRHGWIKNWIEYDGDLQKFAQALTQAKPDAIIHLASLFIAEHKSENTLDLVESNIVFPAALLEAMSLAGCKDLINTGTAWQHYQNQEYNPVSLYAATKQAFEDLCRFYVEARGFRVLNLHLTDSYGPEDERGKLISLLKRIALSGQSLEMSPGQQMIDLVHIQDVVEAYTVALKHLPKIHGQQTYAVSSGQALPLRELVELCARIMDKPLNIHWRKRPYRQREMMQTWTTGTSLPGWEPQIALEVGLRDVLK